MVAAFLLILHNSTKSPASCLPPLITLIAPKSDHQVGPHRTSGSSVCTKTFRTYKCSIRSVKQRSPTQMQTAKPQLLTTKGEPKTSPSQPIPGIYPAQTWTVQITKLAMIPKATSNWRIQDKTKLFRIRII